MVNFLKIRKNEDPILTDVRFPALFEDLFELPMFSNGVFGGRDLAVDVYEEKDNQLNCAFSNNVCSLKASFI